MAQTRLRAWVWEARLRRCVGKLLIDTVGRAYCLGNVEAKILEASCEVGFLVSCIPKRTPGIYTHQYQKGTFYTLTKNSNINPASCRIMNP